MSIAKSKLLQQLEKQSTATQKTAIDQDRLDDVYQILTKIQTKNLHFIQLIVFLIERGFIKNEHKVHYYMDLYDTTKGTLSDDVAVLHKAKQDEEDKFSRKKFDKIFKQMAKKFYPCDPLGFQNNIYKIITSNEHLDEVRLKIDENVKKILTRETINLLRKYERELEIIYEIYLPENFNMKMGFTWQQIKYLQKKLPIIAVFRFLWDSEICPHHMSPTSFFEITSKLIPPPSLLLSLGKQGLFYSPQNILNYAKESVTQKKMKLLEGDMGVNYFQLQVLLVRLSIDITKQKNDFTKAFENLMNLIKLSQVIANKGEIKGKPTRFQENIRSYFEQNKNSNKNNLQVQKRETKKKIQEILQINEQIEQDSRNQFKDSNISGSDLLAIKKNLDDDLSQIPEKKTQEKQNDKTYNIETKYVVIGQQLPKLPEKNKQAVPPKKNDKKDELMKKFKHQAPTQLKQSSNYFHEIIKVPKKSRVNNQFPIILVDVVYPSNIPNLYLNPKCQIYLQATYIYLGQRSYQKAFVSYTKTRALCQNSKNQTAQFFFLILQAQIYQAAARDSMALLNYYKAKQLAQNMVNKDVILKYIAYKGLACCLYHMQQYQYSLRCFMKAKSIRGSQIELESVENAVLENNIGCIYMILNRNNEAMRHFSLSHGLMDLKLGKFHEKSVIVQQNEAKNKKAYIQIMPQFKTMWKTYEEMPGLKNVGKPTKKK